MKVLIFGGNGFLGKALGQLFDTENIEYSTASRSDKQSNYKIDVSNYSNFEKLPNDYFDIIINCATILPGGNFLDSEYLEKIYKTNILGTQNICKWIDDQKSIKSIVNCSTLAVIDKPWPLKLTENVSTYPTGNHVLYSSSKLTQELIFKTFADLKCIGLSQLRFSALYGEKMPWSGIICNLIDQARNDHKIILTNGNKLTVDFLYIADAAKIILAVIKNNYIGILNAASGEEVSLFKLASIISEEFTDSVEIINTDKYNFGYNRSDINIEKLDKVIDIDSFTKINDGIQRMINV